MRFELDTLRFASDATWAGIAAGAALVFAALTLWAERRRIRRRRIDEVGWVPWTKLFFVAMLVGLTLLMFAAKGWSGQEHGSAASPTDFLQR